MRPSEKLRVRHGDLGLRAWMDRQRFIILDAELRQLALLLHIRVQAGIVHHPQREAGGALLQRLLQDGQHLLLFLRRQLSIDASRDGGTG